MQRPKTLAITVALVAAATGTAFALNVGVIRATGPASAGGQSAAEPEVVTVVVDVPVEPDTAPTAPAAALPAPGAAPSAPAPAPDPAPAPTPAPARASAAPSAAPSSALPSVAPATAAPPTAAPSTAAPPTTAPSSPVAPAAGPEFRTFTTGAGQVVVADHGDHLEFWAAHPVDGWQYAVEDATGRELEIEFRRGEQEAKLKVELEDGRIRTESEGFGGDDD